MRLLALIAVAPLALACGDGSRDPAPARGDEGAPRGPTWTRRHLSEAGFSIEANQPAQILHDSTRTNIAVQKFVFSPRRAKWAHLVAVSSVPVSGDAELGAVRDGMVNSRDGILKADKPLTMAGSGGREFEFEAQSAMGRLKCFARLLSHGGKLYQVLGIGRASQSDEIASARRFVQSFQLLASK